MTEELTTIIKEYQEAKYEGWGSEYIGAQGDFLLTEISKWKSLAGELASMLRRYENRNDIAHEPGIMDILDKSREMGL